MPLSLTSLNSGSNGNCYYIGNDTEAVFIDAGISCRETEKRMKRLGLSMDKVKAIFVSHEHTDHISGIPVLAKKFGLPVYITHPTMSSSGMNLPHHQVFSFSPHQPITIGSLSITAFPKYHDASDPHSFIISSEGINVGIFTDIGNHCKHVIRHFAQCHAAFLEANYDDEMLNNGPYPYHLKRRISSDRGHLSNAQALELFCKHKPAYMRFLLLAHLSKENNCPDLVNTLFCKHAGNTQIVVASRYAETAVFTLEPSSLPRVASFRNIHRKRELQPELQLSLF